MKLKFLPVFLCSLITVTNSLAAEVTIKDTIGEVQYVFVSDEPVEIKFDVNSSDASDINGTQVTLKNENSDEVLVGIIFDGSVTFESVGPGTWVVISDSPSVVFVNAFVVSGVAAGSAIVAAPIALPLSVGGAMLAGMGVAVNESQNDSSEKQSDMSPFK